MFCRIGQTFDEGDYSGGGHVFTTLAALRSCLSKIPVFEFDDQLLDLLHASDVDRDIAVGFIENLPFNSMYIQLGTDRLTGIEIHHAESGAHKLEGFYVLKYQADEKKGAPAILDFMFVGEPKAHCLDDSTHCFNLQFGGEHSQISIEDSISKGINKWRLCGSLGRGSGLPSEQAAKNMKALIALATKAILYINHGKYDRVVKDDLTAYSKTFSRITNPAKKSDAIRKGAGLYDRILIKPHVLPSNVPSSGEIMAQTERSIHWRRGHFRNQRYGEKLAFSKPVWIAPVLVNRELRAAESELVYPKDYKTAPPSFM